MHKIALCGAAAAGKSEILKRFVELSPDGRLNYRYIDKDNRMYDCYSKIGGQEVHLQAPVGPFFYTEDKMFQLLMPDTTLIVYVLSAFVNPYDVSQTKESNYFEHYLRAAAAFKKTWDAIPWIFVLNQLDRGKTSPVLERIPPQFANDIIRTIATKGIGISELLKRVEETLNRIQQKSSL